ncbi:anti-sigma factor family protein [Roseiflexus sp.]|uniref:anti-sigma factor family protein n=1 Tax=Roseiflexus sp. TaxID=2562120 RepID=UPI00398A5C07
MTRCYDDGALRAGLDGELPAEALRAQQEHLAACPECRARLAELTALADQTAVRLHISPPDVPVALAALRRRLDRERPASAGSHSSYPQSSQRSIPMTSTRLWRPWMGWAVALAAVLALLAFPPVRAVADQLLNVFRFQNVVFVPVTNERMEQLQQLNFDAQTLFVTPPTQTSGSSEIRSVSSLSEAATLVGFTPLQPALPSPPSSADFGVTDRATFEFQVNVESARELLRLAGVTDVTLPDALGAAPIVAEMSPAVSARYVGDGYEVMLVQGISPQVTLPDGVEMQQLGYAALRMLGMEPRQATALASQIDWRTTLVFPFPADMTSLRQVTVAGSPGLLVSGQDQKGRYHSLYWQRSERFYVLSGSGLTVDAFLAMAESMR